MFATPVVPFVTCPLNVEAQLRVRSTVPELSVTAKLKPLVVTSNVPVQCLPWAAVLQASPDPEPEQTVADAEEAAAMVEANRAAVITTSRLERFIQVSRSASNTRSQPAIATYPDI